MNVVEEYQVNVLHITCLCTIKRGRGEGVMSLILKEKERLHCQEILKSNNDLNGRYLSSDKDI